jgi:multidrug efflux pump subunit AcrA (membrane-fusion protein)
MDKLSRKLKSMHGLLFALAIGSGLTGCSLLPAEEIRLKAPLVKPAQQSYRTVTVEKGTMTQEIEGNGSFESVKTEIVQFISQGGRIDKILVAAGDQVKKGDVLVQLDVDGLDIQLKEQQLSLARAKLALKQAKAGGDQDTIEVAMLQVEIEKMKFDRLLNTLNSRQLVAGMDGQVTFVENLKTGDYADAYRALVIISDPSKLRIALRAEAGDKLSDVQVGMPAHVLFGKQKLEGKVVQTPSSSPDTVNPQLLDRYSKTLYIEVANIPADATIGAFADVNIILQQRDNVLTIPRSGLRSYLERTFVRTIEGSSIREVDVETGIAGSTEIEITKGLEEGTVVILQ